MSSEAAAVVAAAVVAAAAAGGGGAAASAEEHGESTSIFYGDTDVATRRTLRMLVWSTLGQLGGDIPIIHAGAAVGAAYLYTSATDISDAQLEKLTTLLHKGITDDLPVERLALDFAELDEALTKCNNELTRAAVARMRLTSFARDPKFRVPMPAYKVGESVLLADGDALESTGGIGVENVCVTRPSNGDRRCFVVSYVSEAQYQEQPALVYSVSDIIRWGSNLGVNCIGDLNKLQPGGREQIDFVLHSEFRQDMKITEISTQVCVGLCWVAAASVVVYVG